MTERNLKDEARAARTEEQGKLVIVRPSKLAEEGKLGVVAAGVYEDAKPNKFNPLKKDYFIRGEDGTLYIINSTQNLEEQMALIEAGEGNKVEIQYGGKVTTRTGRSVHDFTVLVK